MVRRRSTSDDHGINPSIKRDSDTGSLAQLTVVGQRNSYAPAAICVRDRQHRRPQQTLSFFSVDTERNCCDPISRNPHSFRDRHDHNRPIETDDFAFDETNTINGKACPSPKGELFTLRGIDGHAQ